VATTQISLGKNIDFPAYPRRIYSMTSVQVLGFGRNRILTRSLSLLCDFCSSGQRFAFGFLQTPPHDGSPCLG